MPEYRLNLHKFLSETPEQKRLQLKGSNLRRLLKFFGITDPFLHSLLFSISLSFYHFDLFMSFLIKLLLHTFIKIEDGSFTSICV